MSAWLRDRARPIVFTPGTGVEDVAAFFEQARICCDRLGRPGIFLSSHGRTGGYGANVLHLDYLDLSRVLPHSALLVHHGGVGTTARALEAGVPQIVSPQAFDQFDNGHRVRQLGVGASVARQRLNAETLQHIARWLLQDARVEQRLKSLSHRCRGQRAIEAFADRVQACSAEVRRQGRRRPEVAA